MGSLRNAQGSAGTPKRRTLATRGLGFLLLISSCNAILGNEEGKLDPDADTGGVINGGKANAGKPGSEDGGAGDSSNTDGGKAGKGDSPVGGGGESGDGNEAGAAGTPDHGGSAGEGAGAGGAGGSHEPPPPSGGKGGTGSGTGGKAGSGGSGGSEQGESCDPSTFVPSCDSDETWLYCPSSTARFTTITCDEFCSIFGFPAAGICETTSTNEGFCWCEEYSVESLECDHGALASTNYCAGGCDGCVTEEDYDYIYMDRYLGCYLEEPDYDYVPCYASGWLSDMCIDSCSASSS